MGVSFKVSKIGARFRPKPKPEISTLPQHEEDVDPPVEIHKNQSVVVASKPSVDVTENNKDDAEISDVDISFIVNLFPDGYSIGNPSENLINQAAVQEDPKFLHPYDRTSESLFLAIERGLLPADFLDDIPCKFINGAVACEVRDYRNCGFEAGVNGSSADSSSPITSKIRLRMSLENVVKDMPLISNSSWTYGDLMEAEARILMALHPKLELDPSPNIDRLCKPPTSTNLNLNIRELRRKRLRQMSGPDNQSHIKKVCMDRGPENLNSGPMVQHHPDLVNQTIQNVVPASPSLSYQSKYQINAGNPRLMQDHGLGPVQDMMNSYTDSMNSNLAKRENQDGQLSPMTSLTKRGRSNSMGLDGSQPQQLDVYDSLMQQQQQLQSIGRGIQLPNNPGIQKYPFEGSFNQDPFTMGQPGMRYNLKQEPVDSELNRNMHMVDPDVDPRLQQQQRLSQQFTRSNFPPTPWNNLDNSRKEEQFQRRKTSQSPRVSSGALPQSPLSSKSGEFSSGSHGGQYGTPAPLGSAQRDKSAVTSVLTAGGPASLTSNAQMAARRTNSLPKTPAISGVGSPASVGNISGPGPFSATSPLVGKEADKSMRDRFSKIEMLSARYQLNLKKNKVDEYKSDTSFPTQQLQHFFYNDQNNEIPKDEDCTSPLSKSLVGGSMNVCKTRVLTFLQTERVLQGNGFQIVPKGRTRMILSEKRDDGTVAIHYGELDDYDYTSVEEYLPTLPNTHIADLLAAQFCTLVLREGYHVEGDHLQPKPTNVQSSDDQPNNNASKISANAEIPESVSGQPSNETAKPSDSGANNNNGSVNSLGARMYPPANSQPLQISQGGLLPPSRPLQPDAQSSFSQNQHNLMQQQLQRSSAMMHTSNPLSHLNAMGQNSSVQQLGHMLNKASPLQLQMLQQQQQQQPAMQRKMMMGLGNVGIGGNTGNNMVGLQGMGNVMGGTRGISPPMSGAMSGMGNNMGQNPINMNQVSSISNLIGQQLRSGMITPAQAAIMTTKLRMSQNRSALSGAGGQSSNITGLAGANRQVHPGSSNYSMLGASLNRANMNPMQRTAMAPPKLMSGMNAYMNQQQQLPQQQMHMQQQLQQQQMPHQQQLQQQQMPHQQQLQQQQMPHHHQQQMQESTSPLQAVLSPPQQVGSPSMGLPQQQQASPQQMSQRTPMSPQLSSGTIQPPMSAGNQEANCPASPQLSSQTMGSVSSMANSPMDMQGVNKSG